MKVIRRDLSLIKRLFLVDLIRGLMLTFSYQRPSLNYTEELEMDGEKRVEGATHLESVGTKTEV